MENLKSRSTWAWLLLSGLVGWAVTHLLDMSGREAIPLWSRLLYVISLGSTTVRDQAYADAAMNSYAQAPLILLLLLVTFLVLVPLAMPFVAIANSAMKRYLEPNNILEVKHAESEKQRKGRKLRRLLFLTYPFLILSCTGLAVAFVETNDAVMIRRIYEADRDILAPQLTPMQIALLQSRFCSMKSKADFDALMSDMNKLATERGIKLRQEVN